MIYFAFCTKRTVLAIRDLTLVTTLIKWRFMNVYFNPFNMILTVPLHMADKQKDDCLVFSFNTIQTYFFNVVVLRLTW